MCEVVSPIIRWKIFIISCYVNAFISEKNQRENEGIQIHDHTIHSVIFEQVQEFCIEILRREEYEVGD